MKTSTTIQHALIALAHAPDDETESTRDERLAKHSGICRLAGLFPQCTTLDELLVEVRRTVALERDLRSFGALEDGQ